MKTLSKKTFVSAAFFLVLLAAMLVFFLKLHPIMILDGDDWFYMGNYRLPVPVWGAQNPIKAFPEYFLPLTAYFSGKLFLPVTGNIFTAISLMDGILVGLAAALYFFSFYRLMVKFTQNCRRFVPVILTLLFAVLHFSFLIRGKSGNSYLFLTADQTTYFHYILPALMNSSMVLCLMETDILTDFFSRKHIIRKILFLPLAYFSIFSNVFCCVISAVWVGCSLLFDIFRHLRAEGFLTFLKRRVMKIVFLLVWLVAQIFEMSGNRAAELTAKNDFASEFAAALQNFGRMITGANRASLLILLLIVIAFAVFLFRGKIEKGEEAVRFYIPAAWLAALLTLIYLALICAKAGSWYMTRPDASFGAYFYLLTAVMLMGSQIIKSSQKLVYAFLAAFVVLFCIVLTSGFRESNQGGYDAETCLKIDNDILEQFTVAYEKGSNSVKLIVPKYSSEGNWPVALFTARYYSYAFYNTGVMNRYFYVDMIPSEDKNKELGLN